MEAKEAILEERIGELGKENFELLEEDDEEVVDHLADTAWYDSAYGRGEDGEDVRDWGDDGH